MEFIIIHYIHLTVNIEKIRIPCLPQTDYQPYMSQEMLVHILGGTFDCTCGRIGSCILGGTVHVARQASAYSLKVGHSTVHVGKQGHARWDCTCGKNVIRVNQQKKTKFRCVSLIFLHFSSFPTTFFLGLGNFLKTLYYEFLNSVHSIYSL